MLESSDNFMAFYIGKVKINNRIVFAPMAGVSNISFRTIIKEMGAGLIYSEMISAMGIKYGSKKTIDLIFCIKTDLLNLFLFLFFERQEI